ncbi:hypothetical protein PIB30_015048 [Stylosanthes scabra]|uniref:Uncharacterized protein n=1 Tax=Stylosanthes scabra TaxID=79078 RepID=A0ABU6Z8L3_9FABA|nr:hypothetical protein [Stylosanthes scabra]
MAGTRAGNPRPRPRIPEKFVIHSHSPEKTRALSHSLVSTLDHSSLLTPNIVALPSSDQHRRLRQTSASPNLVPSLKSILASLSQSPFIAQLMLAAVHPGNHLP